MNKHAWIERLAVRADRPAKDAARALETFLDLVKEQLAGHTNVALGRFGTFKAIRRRSRVAYNPKLGREIQVPERWVVRFQATRHLKQEVDARKRTDAES